MLARIAEIPCARPADGAAPASPSTPDGTIVGAEHEGRRGLRETIREFLYGLTGLEFERQALEMRGSLEAIFLAMTLGDLLGLPIMPPIYALRVLPYAVPHIATWKRRVLRPRDFSDQEEFHLHGV